MSQKLKIPPSFSVIKRGGTTLFVKDGYQKIITDLIFDPESLHKYKNDTQVKFGRGSYLSVPVTENSTERLVIRDYRHGGLLGKLFGGVFFNENRPLNEICISEIAVQKGVPSAEVIAITKRRLWGIFYKANFISKEISGALDIIQFLKESSLNCIQKSKKPVIFALVKLVRNMHDAGIYHADLHLKNILLKKDTNGEFTAYIIDLDKSVVLNKLDIHQRIKNLLRLDRSLDKLRWLSCKEYQFNVPVSHGDKSGESLRQKIALISKTDRIRFLKAYILFGNAIDRDWKKYLRQGHSHHALHKFWWRLLGLSRNNDYTGKLKYLSVNSGI
ncbi:MAG TPA: lipopolysaccharide kinase InaA family protein [Candidatus Wunengus sp. YC60]|uniref:lipopolysaccharide kinase InaA family protein n=1 Tax=Candidatus Wunengus sp. YC60 TaxID=3367697 RepID=UPI00402A18D7